jgi:hypothetical protein
MFNTFARTFAMTALLAASFSTARAQDAEGEFFIDDDAYVGKNDNSPLGMLGREEGVAVASQSLTAESANSVDLFREELEDHFGNNRWGAGYQVRIAGSAKRDSWTADTRLEGYANAWGRLFGNSFGVVTVTVVTNTNNNPNSRWGGIWYSIYLFEQKVREETVSGGIFEQEGDIFNVTQPVTPEYTASFPVGPIPVTVAALVGAREYIKVYGSFWAEGVTGPFTPGADLYVQARAGVGVEGANLGFQGSLSLLSASIPLVANIQWNYAATGNPNECAAALSGGIASNFGITSLNGTLDLRGQLGPFVGTRRIAQWNSGIGASWSLISFANTWQFGAGPCAVPVPSSVAS